MIAKNQISDVTDLGQVGAYRLIRYTRPTATPNGERLQCMYGLCLAGSAKLTMSFDDIVRLTNLLASLLEAGEIRELTPRAEWQALQAAQEAAKEPPRRLW